MAKELKKGSFVRRLGAYIIDYVILVILISLLKEFKEEKSWQKN